MTAPAIDALIERLKDDAVPSGGRWQVRQDAAAALVQLLDRIAALEAERDANAKDAVSLLRRARAIINRWQELYGEFQPQFLPPAHQIAWAEDVSEFINAKKAKP